MRECDEREPGEGPGRAHQAEHDRRDCRPHICEIEPYLDTGGTPTADSANAARDERTGQPLANPDASLWIQSTTLQTALMQAYMAFRVSESTAALGVVLVAAGAGLAAAGRR
ncbi:MAG: hypothetical protein ACRDO9_11890 [Gaiellales bacterium]